MALMGRKIAAIRAYVVEGGGADYHDQSAEHWIVKQIATPMSIYPEYHNRWISGSMAGYEPSGSLCSW